MEVEAIKMVAVAGRTSVHWLSCPLRLAKLRASFQECRPCQEYVLQNCNGAVALWPLIDLPFQQIGTNLGFATLLPMVLCILRLGDTMDSWNQALATLQGGSTSCLKNPCAALVLAGTGFLRLPIYNLHCIQIGFWRAMFSCHVGEAAMIHSTIIQANFRVLQCPVLRPFST